MGRGFWSVAGPLLFLGLSHGATALRASGELRPGDIVAICGDSITEQTLYSVFIEVYLLACQPVSGIRTHQFGLSGETSWQFINRLESDVLRFRPTVATTCYGMNDGGYAPIDPLRQAAYRRATTQIVRQLMKALGCDGNIGTIKIDLTCEAHPENHVRAVGRELAPRHHWPIVFHRTYGKYLNTRPLQNR